MRQCCWHVLILGAYVFPALQVGLAFRLGLIVGALALEVGGLHRICAALERHKQDACVLATPLDVIVSACLRFSF